MPTIKDVAREAGVSIATVSYVLNNKPNSVSERTRQQVLNAIDRVGYTPNITARNLKANQTRLIGYAWHRDPGDRVNAVLDRFIYCLAQAAEAAGYHLLTFTHPDNAPTPAYDELIRAGRVDAFVLSGTVINDLRIPFLLESGFPFVSFGRSNPEWDFAWVDTDGQRGVREAVEYLVGLGHRRIAMAAWPEESLSGHYRLAGYMDAMQSAGLDIHPDYIQRGEHSEPFGREAMTRWLQLPKNERPTAVIAITDLVAIGVMIEAERHGLYIGRDLSVIGYDDTPLVQYLRPSLTTLHQPLQEIVQALIVLLERMLQGDTRERHVLIPPRLIVRGSCGEPP
jgi:DNA-binding LacI/PurR family transcriptional regulator